ncbi:SixA phosphatase family protein [Aridibaculum aurantiacum]|uniref:SixA phosphatase family protein n=1 Tax=Aridibaculum aurantiacum TaxID=2810307 RepID=UPI001A970C74|nr:histidine phosphatase family protein [Aridibaculum aurantiacum]
MKKLLLIRHAKSSWDFYNEDFDRPLNDRGHKNAPEMAKRLLKQDIKIDAFVSSPAVRALSTAEYFAKAYDVKSKHIITIPSLYHAAPEIFYSVIEELDDELKTVAIFSHNPGITEFANEQTNTRIDNLPTCGIFAIKADIKHWTEFRNGDKDLWFFDYPKSGN